MPLKEAMETLDQDVHNMIDAATSLREIPEPSSIWEKPKIMLDGPLKPPAAPATYKALTKLRLREGPSRFADVLPAGGEIEADRVFHVLQAKQEDESGILFLRVDEDDLARGWIMDTGVAGKFQAKKVVKRVAGSLGKRRMAIHQISPVERAEVVEPGSSTSKPKGEKAASPNRGNTGNNVPEELMKLLADPQIKAACEKMGVTEDMLQKNPKFVEAITRKFYGDQVVG